MFVLDTDTLTHLLLGQKRVTQKRAQATEEVALTVVTRIEVLQGRFASVLKAEDGEKLLLAQQRLVANERDLAKFIVLPVDAAAARVRPAAAEQEAQEHRSRRLADRGHHPVKPSHLGDLQRERLPQGTGFADRELG